MLYLPLLGPFTLMDLLVYVYLLLASPSWGYVTLRVASPNVRAWAREEKLGAAFLVGLFLAVASVSFTAAFHNYHAQAKGFFFAFFLSLSVVSSQALKLYYRLQPAESIEVVVPTAYLATRAAINAGRPELIPAEVLRSQAVAESSIEPTVKFKDASEIQALQETAPAPAAEGIVASLKATMAEAIQPESAHARRIIETHPHVVSDLENRDFGVSREVVEKTAVEVAEKSFEREFLDKVFKKAPEATEQLPLEADDRAVAEKFLSGVFEKRKLKEAIPKPAGLLAKAPPVLALESLKVKQVEESLEALLEEKQRLQEQLELKKLMRATVSLHEEPKPAATPLPKPRPLPSPSAEGKTPLPQLPASPLQAPAAVLGVFDKFKAALSPGAAAPAVVPAPLTAKPETRKREGLAERKARAKKEAEEKKRLLELEKQRKLEALKRKRELKALQKQAEKLKESIAQGFIAAVPKQLRPKTPEELAEERKQREEAERKRERERLKLGELKRKEEELKRLEEEEKAKEAKHAEEVKALELELKRKELALKEKELELQRARELEEKKTGEEKRKTAGQTATEALEGKPSILESLTGVFGKKPVGAKPAEQLAEAQKPVEKHVRERRKTEAPEAPLEARPAKPLPPPPPPVPKEARVTAKPAAEGLRVSIPEMVQTSSMPAEQKRQVLENVDAMLAELKPETSMISEGHRRRYLEARPKTPAEQLAQASPSAVPMHLREARRRRHGEMAQATAAEVQAEQIPLAPVTVEESAALPPLEETLPAEGESDLFSLSDLNTELKDSQLPSLDELAAEKSAAKPQQIRNTGKKCGTCGASNTNLVVCNSCGKTFCANCSLKVERKPDGSVEYGCPECAAIIVAKG